MNFSHDRSAFPQPARARRRALLLWPDARQNPLQSTRKVAGGISSEFRTECGPGRNALRHARLAHTDLIEQMRGGGTDKEILEWCYARGTRLNRAQVHIWNEFARKVGW